MSTKIFVCIKIFYVWQFVKSSLMGEINASGKIMFEYQKKIENMEIKEIFT